MAQTRYITMLPIFVFVYECCFDEKRGKKLHIFNFFFIIIFILILIKIREYYGAMALLLDLESTPLSFKCAICTYHTAK